MGTPAESVIANMERNDPAARLGVETHVIPGADHVVTFRRTDDVSAFVQSFLERHRF